MIEKVIRDGLVAVLYSPGYGAGWYSWNRESTELLFHPKLVELVEQNRREEITEDWLMENLGIDGYTGGAENLCIEWVHQGTAFEIEEYDGAESVNTFDRFILIA